MHGNAKKKERTPDGGADKNVFDIEQGVAISLFVKKKGLQRSVFHSEFWGSRLSKYQAAAEANRKNIDWQRLQPEPPQFLFVPQDHTLAEAHQGFWSIPQIFSPYGDPAPGFATQHDEFAISFSKKEAVDKVARFLAAESEVDARRTFRLCAQKQWLYETAKKELAQIDVGATARQVLYRPFDIRWTIWNSNVAVHRRERLTYHLLSPNLGLVTSRQAGAIGSANFEAVGICAEPVELNYFRRGGEYIFPLYLYPWPESFSDNTESFAGNSRTENIAPAFRQWVDEKYDYHYTPEEILGYIYAVLYAPTYRARYAEFLRIDFPRVPFPDSAADFETLAGLGWELVQAHLLRELPRTKLAAYHGKGDHTVEAVRYSPAEQAISINKAQCFKPVPGPVWDFHIGGYRVLDKYLKSRKGRKLTLDEINHVSAIADSLAFTIDQMAKIDESYRAAFPDRG